MDKDNLKGRDLITTQEWGIDELESVLDLALEMKREPRKFFSELQGKSLIMLFFNPSTRTRLSFEIGMTQLGGHSVHMDAEKAWIGKGSESIKDTASVMARYADGISIRIFPNITDWQYGKSNAVVREFAKWADVPVINMECDMFHPCQALADILTIKEKKGSFKGKKFVLSWVYHPRPLPVSVPNSALLIATRFGLDVTLLHPKGFELDEQIMRWAKNNCEANGCTLEVSQNMEEAYSDADIIYVKAWGSLKHYGKFEEEKKLRINFRNWICNEALMDLTNKDSIFMHCLPLRRNIEATDGVVDGQHSIIYDEAENRLHVQKAILLLTL
ncbi:MAG: N-acetylornithine carbamoyltransferase [Candidatus Jordarchaeum sp.]|uniref:N-acetylornithine carbamoyltransferase n=1 Tax=Candidatus Jordarchaeum sp. TaxID=2823881 RepID=UPI004049F3E0